MFIIRLLHIFGAIYWVGTSLFMILFLEPVVRVLGPDGGKFMLKLTSGTRLSLSMAVSGWLTVFTGLLLYYPETGGFNPAIMLTARLPLTLGALVGIAAGVVATSLQGRSSGELSALSAIIASLGGDRLPRSKVPA